MRFHYTKYTFKTGTGVFLLDHGDAGHPLGTPARVVDSQLVVGE